ncbi:F-box family protein [Theobroma cacao]|uniref:F-box family protein n=1 Tax=Theobroma cacao TaxID=3641 RepID=S1S461_THECC|nr:F-box family protein [Theobroma cacao]
MANIKMSSIKVTRSTKLKHLKAVKLGGFANEEEEFDLAKQLKEVLEAEPLIIRWDGTALQKVKAKIKPKKTRDRILDFERDKVDVISSLPDHILCRIISFLPFESVVQISVLSTRWKNLWKMALVKDGTNKEAVTAVLNFLSDFPQPRDKWGMQYNFDQGSVLVVAIAPTGILHLDFSAGKQESQRQFSLSLGRNQRIYYYHQPSLSTAFNLKALYLVSVSHVSSEMVSCLLSNIPSLESLTIAKCNGLQSIQLESNSELKKLTVLDCLQLESIRMHINLQFSLNSFQCRGRVVSFNIRMIAMKIHYTPRTLLQIIIHLWTWKMPCLILDKALATMASMYMALNSSFKA